MKFPKDTHQRKVLKTLETLGFKTVRYDNHIAMARENADGTLTPLTDPIITRLRDRLKNHM